ncbi:MAG TPA: hypothetical protein PK019_19815 [Sedimentisphaerales bacterium]|jgi:hypothetical protein|nr:hypothetical protein [Sedimentisphaerales bacterium]
MIRILSTVVALAYYRTANPELAIEKPVKRSFASPAATTSFLPLAPVETIHPFLHPGATSFLPAHGRFIFRFLLTHHRTD